MENETFEIIRGGASGARCGRFLSGWMDLCSDPVDRAGRLYRMLIRTIKGFPFLRSDFAIQMNKKLFQRYYDGELDFMALYYRYLDNNRIEENEASPAGLIEFMTSVGWPVFQEDIEKYGTKIQNSTGSHEHE